MKTTKNSDYVSVVYFDNAIQELRTDFNQRFDEIINRLDDVMSQLQVMREENTFLPYQVTEVRDMAEDHEKRITKLEQTTKTS